ncbi:IS66 family insertion sequence element accessory protein TnpB [Poseidonocella sp. HB161398]|uniref:IS66 family insertion sequence element accessory protein TnpB n=1 Tax=Poseidonocella sp. HB161398 TaxID=2320855 RepID=UPI0011084B17|nr:IS66 family insertion sequence element accessory protein TnpB [Poseidonocella sp. HB161398]
MCEQANFELPTVEVRGTGLVMAYKRLEESGFVWPPVTDGVMSLNRAQFEALFAGLDWRRVKALEARRPAVAE